MTSVAADFDWFAPDQVAGVHGEDAKDPRDRRSPFERDRDRLLHSVAFRRLQGKTQIFASEWADPMRTRLTHTIEVAQIGRAIAEYVGVPGALVEASCLAHDLGHPPFGHVGERALNGLMMETGGFDSNAQSFRVVAELEDKKRNYPGLNLTRAVLLGMLKYPFERSGMVAPGTLPPPNADLESGGGDLWVATQHFMYDSQDELVAWLFEGTPMALLPIERRAERPPRTLICQIVDWADDIAYSVHDFEDGLVTGFLNPARFTADDTMVAIVKNLAAAPIAWQAGHPPTQDQVFDVLQDLQTQFEQTLRVRRRGALREVTRSFINGFILGVRVELKGNGANPFDYELLVSEEDRTKTAILKALTFEYLLKDPRITRYMYKGREILRRVFSTFVDDPRVIDRSRDQLLDQEIRLRLAQVDDDEVRRQRIFADHLSGITERQAVGLYQTMFESTGGSPLR